MAKQNHKISTEMIESKRESFIETIRKEKESSTNGRTSQTQLFLNKIKDLIELAVNDGLSNKQIARSIYLTWNVKISETTVAYFVKNTLKINRDNRTKKQAPQRQSIETKTTTENTIEPINQKPVPVADQKKESSQIKTDGVKHAPADFDDI